MGLQAFRMGANIFGYKKDDKLYAMTCAWATMIDYDKIIMLVGSQSETGNNLNVGLKVGVSALSNGQEKIAARIGMYHSSENKLQDINYELKDNMILIPNASCIMECTILNIDIVNESKDHLVTLSVDKYTNNNIDFLDGYNDKCFIK